ncbi:hypothetical protein L596_017060 [Steinernema carpocapsae]|uniref:Uncharacterized protein n=1 Tax=Steinernema carpocapsae TaxID=34508 RepID=A0A4U5N0M3_STECR|nr:hypothetical protein L596_017060 [Steinernema carpocapsae]
MSPRIVVFAAGFLVVYGCQPNAKGGTCFSGVLLDDQPPQLNQFETCREDLKRDWCTIVYKDDMGVGEAEFHCYNHYNQNPFLGLPVCGDETHLETNSGGCKRVKRYDGGSCLVCCCRGGNCNNPALFRMEQQRFQAGRLGWPSGGSDAQKAGIVVLVGLFLWLY